jgi:hypothetical protein
LFPNELLGFIIQSPSLYETISAVKFAAAADSLILWFDADEWDVVVVALQVISDE